MFGGAWRAGARARKSALGLDALSADKTPTFRPGRPRFAYEWRPRSTIQCVPVNDRIQRPSMRPFNRVRRTCRSPSSNLRTANTFQTLLQTEKWDKKFGTIGNALVEQREWKQRFRTTILSFLPLNWRNLELSNFEISSFVSSDRLIIWFLINFTINVLDSWDEGWRMRRWSFEYLRWKLEEII